MIWNNGKKKRRMEMAQQGLALTSKATLKMQCLALAKGDIKEADELYDYFTRDIQNLPDFDPAPPTWVDNTKDTVNGLLGWFKENQDTVIQAYSLVQQMIANKGKLPTITPDAPAAAPLPPINE